MNRELNPQLFGGQRVNVDKIGQPVDPNQPAAGIMGRSSEGGAASSTIQVPYLPNEVKALESQVASLKSTVIQIERRTDALASKMEELTRMTTTRLERFSQALLRLEENQAQQQQDTTGRMAQLSARVNERKMNDTKIQELVDRHNTIVRNFENRLLSLQRLVSEQEMALHNAQASLEEARSEIARMKRL